MPAVYPTLPTAAGTIISISTTAPANHDAAGFDGITEANWTAIGAVVNSGGFPRQVRDYSDVELLSGAVMVIPGNEKMEPLTINAVFQQNDEGQQALEDVSDGLTVVWLRWRLPSGFKVYAAGYITGYGPTASTSSDYVACEFTFAPIFDVNKVGVIRSSTGATP